MKTMDREELFEKHLNMLNTCDKQYRISLILNFFPALLIMIVSLAKIYLWFTSIVMNNYIRATYTEAIPIKYFDFTVTMVIFPVSLIILILSILSSYCRKKKFTVSLISVYVMLFTVSCILLFFHSYFKWQLAVLIAVYSVFGIWSQDLSMRNYKVMEYLCKQDGYPAFNACIDAKRNSYFSKQRDNWLKKDRSAVKSIEKPIPESAVAVCSESNGMDGISLSENAEGIMPDEYYTITKKHKPDFPNIN